MTISATPNQLGTPKQLCDYTTAVLAQMLSVIQPYVGAKQADYAAHVGAHTRHIIEHYDTLAKALNAAKSDPQAMCTADYDARERNLEVEANPLEAIRRVGLIDAALGSRSTVANSPSASALCIVTTSSRRCNRKSGIRAANRGCISTEGSAKTGSPFPMRGMAGDDDDDATFD